MKKPVKTTNIRATLLSLDVGDVTTIKVSEAKSAAVRVAAARIKDRQFTITEKDRVNDILIKREA